MVSEKATKLADENRIQARRDLESARVLLASPNPHLENVAFLLEQSFEKIIKTSYARYKLETTSVSLNKVCKKMSKHDIDFILDILDEFYKNYMALFALIPKTWFDRDELRDVFPKKMKKMMRSPERLDKLIKQMQNIKKEVTAVRTKFAKFMSELDSKSLAYLDIKPLDVPQISNMVENVSDSETDFVIDLKIFQEYITFWTHLSMAPYVLPHAVHSRYPSINHDMYNLESYRNNPKLKGFFNALADSIQKMLDSEEGFTKLLVTIQFFSSDIPRQVGKT